jgi:predicted negative regulator of RcsB-dependent stress response
MSETTANQAPEATLQEALDKTDFGHWMYEHRKSFIASVIVAFIGASGVLLFKQYQHTKAQERSAEVHKFETTVAAELRAGKLTPADFDAKYKALPAELKASPSMLPTALQTAVYLDGKGESVMAEAVLKDVVTAIGAKSPLYVLVAHSYAALAEKNGKADEAIKALEVYIAEGHKVMLTKAYLDLGRLYLAKNDNAKAKTNFDYIIANYPNDELAKMARMYLQQVPAAQ